MFLQLVRIVFCSGKCESRGNDALDGRVIGEIEEESDTVQRTVFFEIRLKEPCGFHIHAHGRKDDGEVVRGPVEHILRRAFDEAGLSTDLGGNLEGR